jgi:phospholipid/cholesterol/gamma-HCH transport system substrate-binding protein
VQEYRRNEIKVGLTMVVGLAVLLFGFSYFKEWAMSSDTRLLMIRFPTSAGLQAGDQVTINGVKAGKVSAVEVERNSVLVRAELRAEFALASDAVATIQMLELMGGKKIEIRQGASETPFELSHIMIGRVDPDIAGAFAMVGQLEDNVRALTEKANTLLDNVNTIAGDSVMVAALKETVSSLRVLTRDMRVLVTDNRANIQDVAATVVRLTHRTDTLLTELRPLVTTDLKKADALLTGADTLLTDVRGVVSDIRNSKGMFHRLLADTTLNQRFDVLLSRLDSVTAIILDGQLRIKLRL